MRHEIFEQAVFFYGEIDIHVSSFCSPNVTVQYQIVTSQLIGCRLFISSQQSLDTCLQFLKAERLDEIIICSCIQSLYNIFRRSQSCQHNDRCLITEPLAVKMAKFESVYFRHDNIQNNEIERFFLKDFPPRISIVTDSYRMSEFF